MSEQTQPDLASQFRELGENLKNIFQTAWSSEEAQNFKDELRNGLAELGDATTEAVEEFKSSESGQRLIDETKDFQARVESGEVEAKAREEISKAIEIINTELQKAIKSFSKSTSDSEQ